MNHRVWIRSAAVAGLLNQAVPGFATVVGQWNMDNTFGTTMEDSSGNGNNGTTYNIVTSGGGYIFDGTSSKAVVPHSASLNPGADSDFSFTVQVQTDRIPDVGTDYDLIRKGTGTATGGEYKLEIVNVRGKGVAKCIVWDNASHSATKKGTTNIADNLLHTITCSKTSTGLTLTVDALQPLFKAGALGAITTTLPLTIGVKAKAATGVTADWYPGLMRSASVSIGP